MGTRCTCGAGHETFGACIRAKGIKIGWSRSAAGFDLTAEKSKNRELDLYAQAKAQGIQPGTTGSQSTRYALDISDQTGKAFRADDSTSIL